MKLPIGRTIGAVAAFSLAALGAAAWASPPGVTEKDGAWVAPDGKPLYTFTRDTTPGKSACNGGCATNWPPLAAAAGAANDGDWTVITRDDGAKQWAYKGKPLYTYKGDTAGGKATGVGQAWPLAVK
jgi:predicted lipoprotein with Yx(FWY)xxD motif